MHGPSDRASLRLREELNGLSISSGSGQKRKASDAELSSPISDRNPWKGNPTGIPIPGQDTPKPRLHNVHNPYSSMTSGGSKSTRGARQNPSASRTVTNLNISRAERNSFDSRMDISPPPLHTYRKKKGVSPPDAPSKDVPGRRPQIRGRKSLPSIPNPNNQEKEIIDIDESEEDEDPKPNRPSSSGTSVSARRPSSVSRFLRNGDTSFNSASTSKMHSNILDYSFNESKKYVEDIDGVEVIHSAPGQARGKERSEEAEAEASAIQLARRLAHDGKFTERLRLKLAAQDSSSFVGKGKNKTQTDYSSINKRDLSDDFEEEIEIMEDIEPTQSTSSTIFETIKPPSGYNRRLTSPDSSRRSKPATRPIEVDEDDMSNSIRYSPESSITYLGPKSPTRRNTTPNGSRVNVSVREMMKKFDRDTNGSSTTVKKSIKNYDNLKLVGKLKPRSSAKGNNLATSSNHLKIGPKNVDQMATSSTEYSKRLHPLPVDTCVWGSKLKYISEGNETKPSYWLLWDDDGVLKLYKHPQPGELDTPFCQLNLKRTKLDVVEMSENINNAFISINLEENEDLPEDFQTLGILMFKFRENEASDFTIESNNMRHIRDLVSKLCANIQHLTTPSSVKSCLDMVLRRYDEIQLDTQARTRLSSPPNELSPIEKSKEPRSRGIPRMKPQTRIKSGPSCDISLESPSPQDNVRRSGRIQNQKDDNAAPSENPDRVMLVYPPSGVGAINITVGDLRRLEPAEFLNDTLIELGLKFWMNDLRTRQPEQFNDTHVFSSFFFKKLASRTNKTPEEGYNSVRKWTAKVDLFKKKYIIVPINENVHWYLVIIYHPSHILTPASSESISRPQVANIRRSSSIGTNQHPDLNLDVEEVKDNKQEGKQVTFPELIESAPSTSTSENEIRAQLLSELDVVENKADRSTEGPTDGIVQIGGGTDGDTDSLDQLQFRYPDRSEDEGKKEVLEGGGPRPNADIQTISDSCEEEDSSSSDIQLDELPNESIDGPDDSLISNNGRTANLTNNGDVESDEDKNTDRPLNVHRRRLSDSMSLDAMSPDGHTTVFAPERKSSPIPARSFYDTSIGTSLKTYAFKRTLSTSSDPDALDFLGHKDSEDEDFEIRKLDAGERDAKQDGDTPVDISRDSSEDIEVVSGPELSEIEETKPQTFIFSFDSLGGGHPRALSRLNDYLRAEAKDKKGVENPSNAVCKKVDVPNQPNSSDCGLYLIHFVRTFMSDPDHFFKAILASSGLKKGEKNNNMSFEERRKLWKDEEVCSMREEMKSRILKESEEWQKIKAEKKDRTGQSSTSREQSGDEVESDDEVEVMEIRKKEKSPRKPTRAPSLRNPSHNATRMRG